MHLARLAAELEDMRRGRGERRVELRQLLAQIDPMVRHRRNLEHIKLAGIRAELRTLDSRQDPSGLKAAELLSQRRFAALDRQLLTAIARLDRGR